MPGLVGFFKPDSSADTARSALDRMARALEEDPRYQVTLHSEPGVGLGRVGLRPVDDESSLVWNDAGTLCLVFEGELYDQAALEALLALHRIPRPRSTAGLALALYEQFGEAGAAKLNGAFAVAIWDRRTRRLLVFNDRLGLFPLYYARVGGGVIFGSGVRALLAEPELRRTVDAVAIGQFVVYDHMLSDRTLLEDVRLLPQASVLNASDGGTIRPYWTLRYPALYKPQSEADYVEQFVFHLRQAVRRQKPDRRPTAMLLSGGLDSRLLLGMLRDEGAEVESLTFGIPGCDDARVAAEVAGALRTRHHFSELKPDWLNGLADEAVRITDGLANIVNLHVLAPLEEQTRRAQVLYKGFLGDALFGFALKRQMWADYDAAASYRVHIGAHTEQGVVNYDDAQRSRLFTEGFRARIGDAIAETYREGMARAGASQLANQRLYFDLTQRVPRMTLNGVEAARSRAVVRLPFSDNDLLDFALTVPPGFQFERYLPKMALMRHYPRLAQIPMAGTGRPLASCARDIAAQVKALTSWHLRRAGLGFLAARERVPYKDYNRWFRTGLRSWVHGLLLERRTLERGYFNPDYVRQIVAEHDGGASHAVRIGAFLTLELWHRRFVD